jgi:tetratricopeptide (TPR) repeat protein
MNLYLTLIKIEMKRVGMISMMVLVGMKLFAQDALNIKLEIPSNATVLAEKQVLYDRHVANAMRFDSLMQYSEAVKEYSLAIEVNPASAVAFDLRGVSYTKLLRYRKAVNDFGSALQLNPDFAEAYNHRGIVYYCAENYEKALLDYNEAIKLDPGNGKIYFNRGLLMLKLNNVGEAWDDMQKAIDLHFDAAKVVLEAMSE